MAYVLFFIVALGLLAYNNIPSVSVSYYSDGDQDFAIKSRKQNDTNLESNGSEPQYSRYINYPEAADCHCGRVNRRNRIVDGHETEVLEYPWQAKVFSYGGYKGNRICSGSLINSKWVLSSAHCTYSSTPSDTQVILGEHTFDIEEGPEQRFDVTRIINHPNGFKRGYIISLLELSNEVDFSRTWIRPICLPRIKEDFAGAKAIVTGWERSDPKNYPSDNRVLLEYEVPVVGNRDCRRFYSNRYFQIKDSHICAGDQTKHCHCHWDCEIQGDWGSPLITSLGTYYVQIGLASGEMWGCENVGIYTRVTAFRTWIEGYAMTGNVKVCQP